MTAPPRSLASFRLSALILLVTSITWPLEALGGQLTLSWIALSQNELEFSVERSMGIAGPFTVLATAGPGITTYTDGTAADSTIYCYRVRALNSSGYSPYSVPACGTAVAPSTLTLALVINQREFALGDRFRVDITAINGGPDARVDVYFGGLQPPASGPAVGCPDGDAVAYVVDPLAGLGGLAFRCLSDGPSNAVRLYQGAVVQSPGVTADDFFGFNWPLASSGSYSIFMFLTRPGTSEVMALGIATVGYDP